MVEFYTKLTPVRTDYLESMLRTFGLKPLHFSRINPDEFFFNLVYNARHGLAISIGYNEEYNHRTLSFATIDSYKRVNTYTIDLEGDCCTCLKNEETFFLGDKLQDKLYKYTSNFLNQAIKEAIKEMQQQEDEWDESTAPAEAELNDMELAADIRREMKEYGY